MRAITSVTTSLSNLSQEDFSQGLCVTRNKYSTGQPFIQLSVGNFSCTLSMSPAQAEQIAKALLSQVQQIQEEEFQTPGITDPEL